MKSYLYILTLTLFIFGASAKLINKSVPLSAFKSKPWYFLTKFAVGPSLNGGKFKINFQLNKAFLELDETKYIHLPFLIFRDDQWEKAITIPDCKEKNRLTEFEVLTTIPLDGSWSSTIEGSLDEQSQTHIWFFVLSDCDNRLSPYATGGRRIKWQIELLNADGSHFGQDESGILLPLVLVMVIIMGFFISNSIKFYRFYQSQESIDYPTSILTIALFLEFLSLLCEILHLWSYSIDGVGSFILNFSNQLLSVLSQATITCLLVLIAYGWSINTLKIENSEMAVPLIFLHFATHILVVGLGTITEGDHYKHHDYESWAGIMLIILRIIVYIFWAVLLNRTSQNASHEKQEFYRSFAVLSTIYFWTFPCLLGVASMVLPPYLRHKVVYGGTLILQTFTLIVFTILFTSKTMQYHKVSYKRWSLLPSNKVQ